MSAQHTAGVALNLRIGQRVRHLDYKGQRVTGVVHGLSIDSDNTLQVDIGLDAPIVIPARNADDREVSIYRQHVPAHELSPFDERDELIAEMLEALIACVEAQQPMQQAHATEQARAAIAKATGAAV